MSQLSVEDSNVRLYRLLDDLFSDPSALNAEGQASLVNIRPFFTHARGASLNASTGDLYVLDLTTSGTSIVKIQPSASGSYSSPIVSRIALPAQTTTPEGLSFNSVTGTFRIWSRSQPIVYNTNAAGAIVSAQMAWELAASPWGGGGTAPPANTTGQTPIRRLQLVQNVATTDSTSSPDPCGVVYLNHNHSLLISDSEVEEIPSLYVGKNLYGTSLSGSLQYTLTTTDRVPTLTAAAPAVPSAGYSDEPAGISYNPATRALYISDDDKDQIFQVNAGADGLYNTLDDIVTSLFSTRTFGTRSSTSDPEDLAYDPTTGNLFIIDGLSSDVYQVTTEGKLVSQFDTQRLGIVDPEAIAFLDNGNLVMIGSDTTIAGHDNRNRIAEVTTTGQLVQWFDISAANPQKPAALAFAPSSFDSNQRSLYIVDRGLDNDDFASENDGRLYEFALGRTGINQAPVLDAGPTERVVLAQTTIDGSVFDDGLSGGAVTTQWSQVSGSGAATFAQPNAVDTAVSFSTPGSYVLRLSGSDGARSASRQISIQALNPQTTSFVSAAAKGTVGGIAYEDEDILAYDQSTNQWQMYFDGSDVGLTNFNVRDFHINADGSILFAINGAATIAGVGAVDASDIVRFNPTATGTTTTGSFQLYFDGSDVGLTTTNERLDAVAIAPDGRIVLSTLGNYSVPGSGTSISGDDKDLLAFNPTSLGANTAGTWSIYFDGTDVFLNDVSEDVDTAWIDRGRSISAQREPTPSRSPAAA